MLLTAASIYHFQSHLVATSEGLDEDPLGYLLICLKAKNDWLPFGNKLRKNELKHDLYLGPVELQH